MTELFQPGAPKLFTIPPGADFLKSLAAGLTSALPAKADPAALSKAVIYVPNRRSARALALELYRAGGETALILPDIRALGDLETDDAPSGAEEALAGLGPALEEHERLGALTQLVLKFYERTGTTLPPVSAMAAARELSRLLDQASLSGEVDWSKLSGLVEESELAGHWELSAKFLEIIAEAWPKWLAERGALDPFERRLRVAEAIGRSWRETPPTGPVIIAGSTGATPATQALMKAAMTLERSAVVLPGLDQDADEAAWPRIAKSPAHAQNALAELLKALERTPQSIALWPGTEESAALSARRKLINEALAPADDTADWLARLQELAGDETPAAFASQALNGLTILDAADESEEALYAALLMRETLETDDQSAAFVTPDAALARRVSSHLKRWGVDVEPSSGRPLTRTPAGALVFLALDWLADPGDPVALAALAKHGYVAAVGFSELELLLLRGPRRCRSFAELKTRLMALEESPSRERALGAFQSFETAAERALPAQLTLADTADRLAAALTSLCRDDTVWSGPDGAAAGKLIDRARAMSGAFGVISADAARDVFEALAQDQTLRPPSEHPRLSIWGPLEARLQSADRLILAGLNEGVWPAQPSADGFLPRRFRAPLGLSEPEERIGLAAHDFAQLACAPDVTMIVAGRREDAPAVASRWVWRLRTLAKGALGSEAAKAFAPEEGRNPKDWAGALSAIAAPYPPEFAKPRPKPPLEARPKRLSVTRIDTLQRDPYAIYAERILRLSVLDPLDAPMDARWRGTAIHQALEDFEAEGAPKTAEHLLSLLEHELAEAGEPPEKLAADRAPMRATVEAYLKWRDAHAPDVDGLFLERSGAYEIDIGGEVFTLSAQADRIEMRQGGTLAILDFKTGAPASDKQIAAGLDQQMPLQAVIARQGGFQDAPARPVSELTYIAFRAKFDVSVIGGSARSPLKDVSMDELADKAEAGLKRLIAKYGSKDQPYPSGPRVPFLKYDYGYNRLARRDEWMSERGDE